MTPSGTLAGKRALVVEDEYFIASDLSNALRIAGADVMGPVANLDQGLALVDEHTPDAVVLDVNLYGGRSFPLADRLTTKSVPFVFLTGDDGWALPESYRDAPRIAKPCPMPDVVRAIAKIMEAR